jgi:hypothetical protein
MKNKFVVDGEVVRVFFPCDESKVALFDLADLSLLEAITGTLSLKKGYVRYAYTVDSYKQESAYLHRVIMNAPDNLQIDHINGNRLDNRKSNLRLCTNQLNQQNKEANKNNSTGVKNVHWHSKQGYYQVSICANGKLNYIGRTKDFDEAVRMAEKARREYHLPQDFRLCERPSSSVKDLRPMIKQRLSVKNKTGVLGVCETKKGKKYQAQIYKRGKTAYLGTYDTLEEAEATVTKARQEYEREKQT